MGKINKSIIKFISEHTDTEASSREKTKILKEEFSDISKKEIDAAKKEWLAMSFLERHRDLLENAKGDTPQECIKALESLFLSVPELSEKTLINRLFDEIALRCIPDSGEKKIKKFSKIVKSAFYDYHFFHKYPDYLKPNDLKSYDKFLVGFSGGKDSVAVFLYLLDMGVPKEKIELWHHDVDGRESEDLFDWSFTRDYCQKFADTFGVKIYFSWRQGGIAAEMTRTNQSTNPVLFETPEGVLSSGGQGPKSTRMLFPQISTDLSVRWCSSYMKIGVASAAINNQERFHSKKICFLTGERGEESTGRSLYRILEPHGSDARDGQLSRHVDHYRPLREWKEDKVWNLLKKHKVKPNVVYQIGFSRLSCAFCIFGDQDHFASVKEVYPERFKKLVKYEKSFKKTMKRDVDLIRLAESGGNFIPESFSMEKLRGDIYPDEILTEKFELPSGAFRESKDGPT